MPTRQRPLLVAQSFRPCIAVLRSQRCPSPKEKLDPHNWYVCRYHSGCAALPWVLRSTSTSCYKLENDPFYFCENDECYSLKLLKKLDFKSFTDFLRKCGACKLPFVFVPLLIVDAYLGKNGMHVGRVNAKNRNDSLSNSGPSSLWPNLRTNKCLATLSKTT